MDYQKFVNNASFTIFVAVVLVLVTIVCIIFLKNGWKEAERLGVSKEELKKIVINCIGISLVPSIPIVLSVQIYNRIFVCMFNVFVVFNKIFSLFRHHMTKIRREVLLVTALLASFTIVYSKTP